MKASVYKIAVLLFFLAAIASCKKGYITPEHVQPQVTSDIVQIINIANNDYANVYFNGLPISTGTLDPGEISPKRYYSLPAVNGQTFQLKIVFTDATLDTTLTVAADGLDAFFIYKNSANNYAVYTLHTAKESPPGKGNIKIRFANLYPKLPGGGSVKVQLSRKENYLINNDKPLAFGEVTPYIEVPFGVYQPLVLNELNKPVLDSQELNPGGSPGIRYTWSQITLLPGGVYTFLNVPVNDPSGTTLNSQSSQLKQDAIYNQTAGGKVLFIHANPILNDVLIKVDGQLDYASPLSYGNSQNPFIVLEGTHDVQITDAAGNVLADKQITVFDKERDAVFLVDNAAGKPDILFFNLEDIDNTSTAVTFFNFSPDLPPVTFLSEKYPGVGGLYIAGTNTVLFNDSLSTNVPYLRIPMLNGKHAAPEPTGSDYLRNTNYLAFNNGYYDNGVMTPPKLKIAINVVNDTANASNVIPGVYIDYPFDEFPSFARYDVAKQNFYEGDAGYFLVMVIGERYPKNPLRSLQLKSFKYVD